MEKMFELDVQVKHTVASNVDAASWSEYTCFCSLITSCTRQEDM
ncbi:FDLD family class I lanthipeptide [Tumebacillus sp. ITR2]|uniref:FDLD family class I lanthipeptide n=1 Tax=Tumebacillus amylolyticus TaxID=2801339 RepID=A0ABS1JEF5_9BACL|nr:FDLD family class I lanthipeptide [Tumebacillus amylolyticus]MBL0388647.1 FDLD family class I lanthipeptide [Tumebacillus amylolyticus]